MPLSPRHDRRQHPRLRAAWPVVVKAGATRYLARSVNISTHGVKIRTNARLRTGTTVQLELVTPEGSTLSVDALVWRVDTDGMAFLFSTAIAHRLLPPV